MANVKLIGGTSIYVTSGVKLGDLLKLEKYNPKALVLMGGEDNKTQVFRVMTVKGGGCIDKLGAAFDATKDPEKPASLTMVYTGSGDIKQYVKDNLGAALVNLGKIEAAIPAALETVAADSAALDEMIEVIE